MSPEPLYRIIYSDGAVGYLWSWDTLLQIIRHTRGERYAKPVRVERVQ